MASGARVFNGCRALFAAAKSATPKSTATKKAAEKPKAAKPVKKRPASSGIMKPNPVSPALSNFLGGVSEAPRSDVVKKIWEYIKLHDLQNPLNKREIICDEKLKLIFQGKEKVGMLEVAKLLSPHFVKTA